MSPSTTTWAAAEPERDAGDVDGADPVHVADVAEPLERARLAADRVAARAQHDAQVGRLGAGGERDPDVLQVVGGDRGERDRAVERQPPQQRRVGAAADHDRQPEPARVADVLAVGLVVDRDDRDAALAQQHAEPQPDLAEPDDDDVVGARHRAAAEQAGQVAADQPLDEPAGERGGEQQRDQHA